MTDTHPSADRDFAFGGNKMMLHVENIVIHEDGAQLLSRSAVRALPIIT